MIIIMPPKMLMTEDKLSTANRFYLDYDKQQREKTLEGLITRLITIRHLVVY